MEWGSQKCRWCRSWDASQKKQQQSLFWYRNSYYVRSHSFEEQAKTQIVFLVFLPLFKRYMAMKFQYRQGQNRFVGTCRTNRFWKGDSWSNSWNFGNAKTDISLQKNDIRARFLAKREKVSSEETKQKKSCSTMDFRNFEFRNAHTVLLFFFLFEEEKMFFSSGGIPKKHTGCLRFPKQKKWLQWMDRNTLLSGKIWYSLSLRFCSRNS